MSNIRVTNLTGQAGSVVALPGTLEAEAGRTFCALQVAEAAAFSAIEGNMEGSGNLSGKVLPAGFVLYGAFTRFSLSSGTVVAYYN